MKHTIFEGHGAFARPSLSDKSSSQVRDRRLVLVRNYLAEVGAGRSPGEFPAHAHEVQTCIEHPHQCGCPGRHAR